MKYAVSDSLVITKRQLLQLIRVPEVLIFSTIQPVMFVLLFRFVFGGSISTGIPGVDYVQLLMPDRKSTRLNSSHVSESRMPSSA